MEHLNHLINHYGYLGIVLSLIGGIVGLPIPDEVLLTYIGYHVFTGNIAFLPAFLCAYLGASIGITLSFILGITLGAPFLHKFGPKLHITKGRIDRTRRLIDKWGPILLVIGFFIPGVRHITAYLAGINHYSYRRFALFAYFGAMIWCFTFITLGNQLGQHWGYVGAYFSRFSFSMLLVLFATILVFSYRRKLMKQIQKLF